MDIVIDFDGTVVTHVFPHIDPEDIGSEIVLKELISQGHKLILFTMRSDNEKGKFLEEAVAWFVQRQIPLYGIQKNPTQEEWTSSPKAYGQLIIDDAALGIPLMFNAAVSNRPFVNWDQVYCRLVATEVIKHNEEVYRLSVLNNYRLREIIQ